MRNGFHLMRIAGISIDIDWSLVFIFLLVTWQLAVGVFPVWHPAWPPALNWGLALLAAILFFASILTHELAHSLVARAKGLPVRRITLFLFGGVSNLEREPSSAGDEFLIAVVGPLTSIVLGAIFLVVGGLAAGRVDAGVANPLQAVAHFGPLPTLLLWLGSINILLGIFNLIPGFPLDGGRILRSILWGVTHNLRRATRWAAGVGQAIAWLMIIAGIAMIFGVYIPFFGTGLIGGIWLAFIGWFLNNAAVASYQQVVIHDMLEGVPVARLMRPNVPSVPPDISVADLVHGYLMGTEERAFPIVEGDQLIGLVCVDDVRKVPRNAWETTTARQIMTPAAQVEATEPEEDASEAILKLARRDVNQMPVLDHGHLVGMLRRRDIVRWLQLHSDGLTPG